MTNRAPVDLPEGYVDFYKNIESWQNELFFRLKRTVEPDELIADFPSGMKKPVLESQGINLDPEAYKGAFLELIRVVEKERNSMGEMLRLITTVFSDLDFAAIAARVVNDDQKFFGVMAKEKGFAGELAYFLLDHALRPFLRRYALPYQDAMAGDDFEWELGICPVCGSRANFSRVRAEDGRRFLFCEHCFTEWQFKYRGCMFCGNSEPGSLKFLVLEGDDANQIFVCEKCRGYLKTFDERKGRMKSDPFIAGIETAYLDLIAEEQGYTNKMFCERNLN